MEYGDSAMKKAYTFYVSVVADPVWYNLKITYLSDKI